MPANPLGHLTVAQLEAAEDYLGVPLDQAQAASQLRLMTVGAWAKLLRDNPAATLADARALPFERAQQLAEGVNGGGPGEA